LTLIPAVKLVNDLHEGILRLDEFPARGVSGFFTPIYLDFLPFFNFDFAAMLLLNVVGLSFLNFDRKSGGMYHPQ